MKNIIIIGTRGFQAEYGGWETFVTNLVKNYNDDAKFHIPQLTLKKNDDNKIIKKDNASCLEVYAPSVGFATMFIYAIRSLIKMKSYISDYKLDNCLIYVLGCRMGPFYKFLVNPLKKMGIKIYLNPDGLEYKREKWSWWIKQCFKISEYCMVKNSDYIICDSQAIKDYIDNKYQKFHKTSYFIAYGAYLTDDIQKNDIVDELYKKYHIKENNYYLIVGRFVPENNYELIIRQFMKSNTKKDLVIVSNVEKNKYYNKLVQKTNFTSDKRIKFVGSLYDKQALIYLRSSAYAYIHGHSAGGTNPSLLEALATTKVNILFDVVYNKEVGEKSCFYFTNKEDNLKQVINEVENLDKKAINKYGLLAKKRIEDYYTWQNVAHKYKKIWK